MAAIFAAPLAAAGSFAGSHKGSWVELVSTKVPRTAITEIWVRATSRQKTYTSMIVDFGKGKILRYQNHPRVEPPWVYVGTYKHCTGLEHVSMRKA